MEEKKNEFLVWVRAHKKQLILAGVGVVGVIGVILGIKNKDTLMELWASLKKDVSKIEQQKPTMVSSVQIVALDDEVLTTPRKYTLPQAPVEVRSHIRNLAPGQVHSAAKAEEAKASDIFLLPSQTLVDSYYKYVA